MHLRSVASCEKATAWGMESLLNISLARMPSASCNGNSNGLAQLRFSQAKAEGKAKAAGKAKAEGKAKATGKAKPKAQAPASQPLEPDASAAAWRLACSLLFAFLSTSTLVGSGTRVRHSLLPLSGRR